MVKQSVKKPKKPSAKASDKVDYEPNKMGLAIATGAAVSLVLLGMIAMLS